MAAGQIFAWVPMREKSVYQLEDRSGKTMRTKTVPTPMARKLISLGLIVETERKKRGAIYPDSIYGLTDAGRRVIESRR